MTVPSSQVPTDAEVARCGDRRALAAALRDSRRDTLATFAAWERALPSLVVPRWVELNPPLWELGHVGWFQTWWTTRLPDAQRRRGARAHAESERAPADPPEADRLYDSSRIAHAARWDLHLSSAQVTRERLERQLEAVLESLAAEPDDQDETLYFYRLVLLHEDMHHEAALYMARALGVPIDDGRWQPPKLPAPSAELPVPGGTWTTGWAAGGGFAFDNELPATQVATEPAWIDARVLRWSEYLPFAVDGGYRDERWWDAAGLAWLRATGATAPRFLGRQGSDWRLWRGGAWTPLDVEEPACHLSAHEARAWCRWAGRRLPTEAQWERAALSLGSAFRWGDVWEWTASDFAPFPGFEPHPYRDYSAPWFDGRPVLRGASFLTQPRMRHPRYRNFFTADRTDIAAGFRTCR